MHHFFLTRVWRERNGGKDDKHLFLQLFRQVIFLSTVIPLNNIGYPKNEQELNYKIAEIFFPPECIVLLSLLLKK